MTDKRFSIDKEYDADGNWEYCYVDNDTGRTFNFADDFCDIDFIEYVNAINDENEQLKSTMKEVAELLEEEVDLFSDKATEHDINAYVELREFDNKDAYYMAISTKKAIKMLKGDVE